MITALSLIIALLASHSLVDAPCAASRPTGVIDADGRTLCLPLTHQARSGIVDGALNSYTLTAKFAERRSTLSPSPAWQGVERIPSAPVTGIVMRSPRACPDSSFTRRPR